MDFIAYFLNRGRCYLCNKQDNIICQRCFSKLESIEKIEYLNGIKIYSLYKYNQTASKILKITKYPPYQFYVLKYLLNNSIFPELKYYFVIPVPLHSLKYFERGFNQVEIISNFISRKFNFPQLKILKRTRYSLPLYKLGEIERNKEVSGIFKIKLFPKILFKGIDLKILLIDDLLTTGSTAMACCKVLKDFGFKEVDIFSLFRA